MPSLPRERTTLQEESALKLLPLVWRHAQYPLSQTGERKYLALMERWEIGEVEERVVKAFRTALENGRTLTGDCGYIVYPSLEVNGRFFVVSPAGNVYVVDVLLDLEGRITGDCSPDCEFFVRYGWCKHLEGVAQRVERALREVIHVFALDGAVGVLARGEAHVPENHQRSGGSNQWQATGRTSVTR